jgi:hypothetical protein
MGDDRAIVYVENDIPIYRASSLGNPLRCLVAARAGNTALEAPEYLQKAATAGHMYEGIVKERLVKDGWVIDDEQGFVEVKVPLNVDGAAEYAIIRGHLDAMGIHHTDDPMDDRMLEVKSMSTNVFDKWNRHRFDGFPTYAAQLTFYMAAAGKPSLYAVICRDTDELELIPYDEAPMDVEFLYNKVRSVEALNIQGIIPPCSGAIYDCAYDYMCDKRDISHADLEILGDDVALADALERYEEAREQEALVKTLKGVARDDVIAAMAGRKKADVGFTRITHSSTTRKTLDAKRLREELGDDLDNFYNESTSTTLRVTTKKETE